MQNRPISPTPSPYSSPLLSPSLSTLTQPCPVIVVHNFSLLPPLLVRLSIFVVLHVLFFNENLCHKMDKGSMI